MKIIRISTIKEKFFLQYVTLLYPFHKMREKQIQVLAQLMYYNDKYKHLEEEVREKMLFDSDTKAKIRQSLKMSEGSFNNNMSELRKKKAIIDNALAPMWRVYLDGTPKKLTFDFNITDLENGNNP